MNERTKKIECHARELNAEEIRQVSGGVHLGGLVNSVVQYLWSRSLT